MSVGYQRAVAVLALCFACGHGSANADTIVVDQHGGGDYVTIQEGLNAAVTGDTVLVMAGTYYERLVFNGPTPGGVTLLAAAGPESTIIDGQGVLGSPLLTCSETYYGFTVSGLTFANALSSVEGAAIRGIYGTVSVVGNVIRDNEVTEPALGGAVALMYSETSPSLIAENEIYGNRAPGAAGILLYSARATISDNHIFGNTVPGSGNWNRGGGVGVWVTRATLQGNRIESNEAWRGAGVDLLDASPTVLEGNSITGNVAGSSGGGLWFRNTRVSVEGNLFSENEATRGAAVYGGGSGPDSCVFVDNVFSGNTATDSVSIDFTISVLPRLTHNYLGDPCATQLRAMYVEFEPGTMGCRHNWWGTNDPERIAARIFDCSDSGERWCVDFSDWCENPSCSGSVTGTSQPEAVSWGRLKSLYDN